MLRNEHILFLKVYLYSWAFAITVESWEKGGMSGFLGVGPFVHNFGKQTCWFGLIRDLLVPGLIKRENHTVFVHHLTSPIDSQSYCSAQEKKIHMLLTGSLKVCRAACIMFTFVRQTFLSSVFSQLSQLSLCKYLHVYWVVDNDDDNHNCCIISRNCLRRVPHWCTQIRISHSKSQSHFQVACYKYVCLLLLPTFLRYDWCTLPLLQFCLPGTWKWAKLSQWNKIVHVLCFIL